MRGRGEGRVPAAPAAPCAGNCAKSAHGSNHRQGGITPAFPAQWFTAYFELSPVNQLVATVVRASCTNLAPASARQDHTTWPSADMPFVDRHISRPPQPASRVVTIAIRPFFNRGGMRRQYGKSEFLKRRKFSQPGLDRPTDPMQPTFEVKYTFGIEPLQQCLIEFFPTVGRRGRRRNWGARACRRGAAQHRHRRRWRWWGLGSVPN